MDILWHQIGRLAKIMMNVWKRTMEAVIKCVSILLEDINANATLDLEKSRSKVRVRTSTNVKIFQPCVVMEIVSIYVSSNSSISTGSSGPAAFVFISDFVFGFFSWHLSVRMSFWISFG